MKAIILLVSLFGAVWLHQAYAGESKEQFEQVYSLAEAARKEASALGHEWRDTRKLLKRAKRASKNNHFGKALALAQQAHQQSLQAIEQAQYEAKHWQAAVPKLQPVRRAALTLLEKVAPTAENFKTLFAETETARRQAASLGHEWRDTGRLIKRAKRAAGRNDYAKAISMLQQARQQSLLAVEQAQRESKNWPNAVPR